MAPIGTLFLMKIVKILHFNFYNLVLYYTSLLKLCDHHHNLYNYQLYYSHKFKIFFF